MNLFRDYFRELFANFMYYPTFHGERLHEMDAGKETTADTLKNNSFNIVSFYFAGVKK